MLKKGDKSTIRAWAMYDWANSAYALTITSAIFPGFYEAITSDKDAAGNVVIDYVQNSYGIVNTSLYSYAIAAGFLIVALIAPLLSGMADYSDSKKRYMKFFCYLGAVSCAGLYWFSMDNIWLGMSLVALACIGFSGSIIFYNAFLPEIADPEDHDRVSALGFSMGYIGSVLLLLWNLSMLIVPDLYFDVQGMAAQIGAEQGIGLEMATTEALSYYSDKGCRISFLSVGIWWALFAQITFLKLPDRAYKKKITNDVILNGYREVRKVFNEIKSTVRLRRYLIAFFLYNTGVQTVMFMAANFAAKEIKRKGPNGEDLPFEMQNLIITILIIQLVGIIGAYLFSFLSKKFGNIRALKIAVIYWVLLTVAAYFVVYEFWFYVLAAGVGMVMGGVQALSRSTYSKLIPPTFDHASYFSFYNICYYIGTVVGTFGFGYILDITDNIRMSILLICIFFIAGLVMLYFVPKEEKVGLEAQAP
ncbi:MAG: MFS transporter [Flavobacteriales bacterium]|nr:MFS transporter [Flavobacteriales bacterium]NNK81441.1 MFS transporter [Flavobacteriales bacterium]